MPINAIRNQCMRCRGGWIQFQTQVGMHRGIVERVEPNRVLVRVPRQYAPGVLASAQIDSEKDPEKRLDLALTSWGYGPGYAYGYRRPGYGAYGNGWWGGGWWWWWLAFASIFWLAFLW